MFQCFKIKVFMFRHKHAKELSNTKDFKEEKKLPQ